MVNLDGSSPAAAHFSKTTMSNHFHWTREGYGYALRDSRGYARAVIGSPNRHQFFGILFIRNLPESGPYKSRKEAADWVTSMAVRLKHLPADSTFDDITKDDRKMPERKTSLEAMG